MWKLIAWLSLFGSSLGYATWVYSGSSLERASIMTGSVLEGKRVYQRYNCAACHQIYGLGGYLGPDLTHMMSAPGKGGLYANAVIRTGNERMPAYDLSESEMRALIGFFTAVDQSGAGQDGSKESQN